MHLPAYLGRGQERNASTGRQEHNASTGLFWAGPGANNEGVTTQFPKALAARTPKVLP